MTPEYRKMLWGPSRGDGQRFQGGGSVCFRPPGFVMAAFARDFVMYAGKPRFWTACERLGRSAPVIFMDHKSGGTEVHYEQYTAEGVMCMHAAQITVPPVFFSP